MHLLLLQISVNWIGVAQARINIGSRRRRRSRKEGRKGFFALSFLLQSSSSSFSFQHNQIIPNSHSIQSQSTIQPSFIFLFLYPHINVFFLK